MHHPPALLIVDFQTCFADLVPDYQKVLKRTCFAAEVADLFDLPLIITEQNPEKLGHTAPELSFIIGKEQHRVAKQTFSAFVHPEVQQEIRAMEGDHLLIAGLETPVCIYQTVLDAVKAGYHITVLRDCVGARREADAAAIWHAFGKNPKISVLPSETVFYRLLRSAEHPKFKAFNELVKRYHWA